MSFKSEVIIALVLMAICMTYLLLELFQTKDAFQDLQNKVKVLQAVPQVDTLYLFWNMAQINWDSLWTVYLEKNPPITDTVYAYASDTLIEYLKSYDTTYVSSSDTVYIGIGGDTSGVQKMINDIYTKFNELAFVIRNNGEYLKKEVAALREENKATFEELFNHKMGLDNSSHADKTFEMVTPQ